MVSYEVALGLSLMPVLMLAGNVSLPAIVTQQQMLGFWYIFPLSLAFIFFVISAFAETNRLPFDLPEAESELITGYHTEYSAMKFSMFFIAEYSHILTASALMATLFLGGWSIPLWSGANMFWHEGALVSGFTAAGDPIAADPTWWKTVLTLLAFSLKTAFFVVVFIWVRWTLPRFRYDQVMQLGWKVMLPISLGYLMLVAATILILDQLEISGFTFGLALTGVSGVATAIFVFIIDRGRLMGGVSGARNRPELVEVPMEGKGGALAPVPQATARGV
jgi:NADH-quinone oxidoreductase subunit H